MYFSLYVKMKNKNYNKIKIYPMKKLSTLLFLTLISAFAFAQFETRLEDQQEWLPAFKIELGFIFFTISYTKVSI